MKHYQKTVRGVYPNEIIGGCLQHAWLKRGEMAKKHKYIKREGSSGHYRYTYPTEKDEYLDLGESPVITDYVNGGFFDVITGARYDNNGNMVSGYDGFETGRWGNINSTMYNTKTGAYQSADDNHIYYPNPIWNGSKPLKKTER